MAIFSNNQYLYILSIAIPTSNCLSNRNLYKANEPLQIETKQLKSGCWQNFSHQIKDKLRGVNQVLKHLFTKDFKM